MLPGGTKRAVSYQTKGKRPDLATVPENVGVAGLTVELLSAWSLLMSPGTL